MIQKLSAFPSLLKIYCVCVPELARLKIQSLRMGAPVITAIIVIMYSQIYFLLQSCLEEGWEERASYIFIYLAQN